VNTATPIMARAAADTEIAGLRAEIARLKLVVSAYNSVADRVINSPGGAAFRTITWQSLKECRALAREEGL
jgi:hypothetical protein